MSTDRHGLSRDADSSLQSHIVKFLGWRRRTSGVTELYMDKHSIDLWDVINNIDANLRSEYPPTSGR